MTAKLGAGKILSRKLFGGEAHLGGGGGGGGGHSSRNCVNETMAPLHVATPKNLKESYIPQYDTSSIFLPPRKTASLHVMTTRIT